MGGTTRGRSAWAAVIASTWLAACGGGANGNGSGAQGGAGTSGGGASSSSVYPTRMCVLDGSCGTCLNEMVCWEGFQADGCPSFIANARYAQKTCPELGFPVNCSGQNEFEPPGTSCSGSSSGGTGTSPGASKAEGDACTSSSQCPSGTQCEHYLGVSSQPMRCMRKCTSHGDCLGTRSANFALPLSACDYCNGGPQQCVPLDVCGYTGNAASACDDCISGCQGLPSCCTGCGCVCESECGGC